MFRNALIAFGVVISIFLILFISLLNGISINNISFNSINIQGLYLKYDKKLHVKIDNFSIFDSNDSSTIDMSIKLSVEKFFDKYFLQVDEYLLKKPYLKISGNIVVDPKNINLENISSLYINNLNLLFHEKLKPINAEKCFITYENEVFDFSFKNPTYDNVALDKSKVQIVNFRRLELDLVSKSKLDSSLLFLLSNYKVTLPVEQEYGQNYINVRLSIPFYKKEEMFIYADITTKNGKIYIHEIPLYTKDVVIKLDNNLLSAKGTLVKSNNEHNLTYDINQSLNIDFRKNIVNGKFLINSGKFNEITTNNTDGNFTLNFDSNLTANIELKAENTINIDKDSFYLKKFQTNYDQKKTILVLI